MLSDSNSCLDNNAGEKKHFFFSLSPGMNDLAMETAFLLDSLREGSNYLRNRFVTEAFALQC